MLKLIKNKGGFTLIELLIALAVLGIVIGPLSGFLMNSYKINSSAKAVLESNNIAQTYLENWKAKDLSSLIDASMQESLNQGSPIELPEEDYKGYKVKTSILPLTEYSNDDTNAYTPDIVFMANERPGKLSVYQSAGFKIAELDLLADYVIDIDRSGGTDEISISGMDGAISIPCDGSTVFQVNCIETCDTAFEINNRTDSKVKVFINKTKDSEASNINVFAASGRVETHNTVKASYGNNLYEIQISVSRNGEVMSSLKGLKLIEFK